MPSLAAQLRRPFVRDVGVLQVGGLTALGLSFLLSIALARVLGREAYGAYALVVSTFTTISLFKRLGHDYLATTDLATAYARHDAPAARRTLAAYNAITLWSTLVVIPLAFLLAPTIVETFFGGSGLVEPLRLALLPAVWVVVMANVVIVLQCSRRLVQLTLLESGNTLASGASGLLGALLGGLSGVFWGQLVASLGVAALAAGLYRRLATRDPLLPSPGTLVADPPRVGLAVWGSLRSGLAIALDKNLVSLYPLAPILLLGALATTDQVGLLRVAMSYLTVPLLALSAISRLLMVKLPELHATQPERMRRFFLQVTTTGGAISILLTLPVVALAPWLIELLYGAEFGPAVRLVPLLALDPLLAGFGLAAGPIFRTYRRNLWAVWANLAVLALGLPAAWVATHLHGLEGAALSYAALVTTLRLLAYLLCLRLVGTEARTALA